MSMMIDGLKENINNYFQDQIKTYPAKSNQASQLALPIRAMVLRRIASEYGKPHDARAQRRMERGKMIEDHWLNQVLPTRSNIKILERGSPADYPDYQIGGRVDAIISITGEEGLIPLELKTSQYFSKYHAARDFLAGGIFEQNWYHQLNTYCLARNKERGLFLLIDPMSFEEKWILHEIDIEEADKICAKCKEVNAFVAQFRDKVFRPEDVSLLPDCGECYKYCPFEALCGKLINPPDDAGELDLEKIDYLVARKLALDESAREYDTVKDELRFLTAGYEIVVTSRFMIQGAWQAGPSTYDVPKEIKDTYKKPGKEYWRVKKIIKIGE